jgi:hypothetical protein
MLKLETEAKCRGQLSHFAFPDDRHMTGAIVCDVGGKERMTAPDLDSAIARLTEMVHAAGAIVPFTGGCLDGVRHSGFPFAGRTMDQEPADRFRRVHVQPGGAQRILAAALCDGGPIRRRQARSRSSGHCQPLSRRKDPGRGHAKHRQFAPSLGNCAGRCHRVAWQYDICRLLALQ